MRRLVPLDLRPWTLPLIVAALAVPIVAGFLLAGPQLGLAVGALAVGAVLLIAARATFDEPIVPPPSPDDRYRLLVVIAAPVDEPRAIGGVVEVVEAGVRALGSGDRPQLLVLAPALSSPLDRWASDLGEARAAAGRALALTLAALAVAGLEATGAVGDPDPVQAIADRLATFPAREVALVRGPGLAAAQASEVRRRLDRPVRLLEP